MIAARIAENSRQRSEVKGNTDKAQMLDDEMFALYLQNEEFLNDLRQDEDFMRTLERGETDWRKLLNSWIVWTLIFMVMFE